MKDRQCRIWQFNSDCSCICNKSLRESHINRCITSTGSLCIWLSLIWLRYEYLIVASTQCTLLGDIQPPYCTLPYDVSTMMPQCFLSAFAILFANTMEVYSILLLVCAVAKTHILNKSIVVIYHDHRSWQWISRSTFLSLFSFVENSIS